MISQHLVTWALEDALLPADLAWNDAPDLEVSDHRWIRTDLDDDELGIRSLAENPDAILPKRTRRSKRTARRASESSRTKGAR